MELVVAMSLLFIVLTMVYESFQINVRTMESARAIQRDNRVARLAFEMMARDLQSVFLDPKALSVEAPEEEQTPIFMVQSLRDGDMHLDRMAFLTLAPPWGMEWGHPPLVHEVEYRVARDLESNRPLLVRREDPTPDGDLLAGGDEWLLSDRVVGFQVECINANGETSSSWDSRNSDQPLPRAVILKLWVREEGGKEGGATPRFYSTRVSLPSMAQQSSP
jgi:hypothetical protein